MGKRYYRKGVKLFSVLMHCTPSLKVAWCDMMKLNSVSTALSLVYAVAALISTHFLSVVDNLSCTCCVYAKVFPVFFPYVTVHAGFILCWTGITECNGCRPKTRRCPPAERFRTTFWIRRSKKRLIWCCWAVEWEHTLVTRLWHCWMSMDCIVSSAVSIEEDCFAFDVEDSLLQAICFQACRPPVCLFVL